MAHNLKSPEIRKMYDFLYKYERKIKDVRPRESVYVEGLESFLSMHDIYIAENIQTEKAEVTNHKGYFLYRQAKMGVKVYWLLRHLRDAFAHGFVEYDVKSGTVRFSDGEKKIAGLIQRELLEPFFELLYYVNY